MGMHVSTLPNTRSHPGCHIAWDRAPCPNEYLLKACYVQVTVPSIRDRKRFKTWQHPFRARDLTPSPGTPYPETQEARGGSMEKWAGASLFH